MLDFYSQFNPSPLSIKQFIDFGSNVILVVGFDQAINLTIGTDFIKVPSTFQKLIAMTQLFTTLNKGCLNE
ncbi:hypothetical protein RR46_12493 [Papilio xuthus]|uniref:Uncharacterized protein n=1 Tax=Papilio xuthus TaxID=66420 RepID=A0A194PU12_PAPXU|nr:hypothetical protein RR46_12493 [Papilio xuthus]